MGESCVRSTRIPQVRQCHRQIGGAGFDDPSESLTWYRMNTSRTLIVCDIGAPGTGLLAISANCPSIGRMYCRLALARGGEAMTTTRYPIEPDPKQQEHCPSREILLCGPKPKAQFEKASYQTGLMPWAIDVTISRVPLKVSRKRARRRWRRMLTTGRGVSKRPDPEEVFRKVLGPSGQLSVTAARENGPKRPWVSADRWERILFRATTAMECRVGRESLRLEC